MVRKNKKITAAILIIGNEILSGRTKDQNVSYLASWLNNNLGIKTEEVRIIPDIEKTIIKNISTLRKKYNYVFTTGGIGPTHDDITAKSTSKALKVKYNYNREAFNILEKYYGKKNFNSGRKKMAKMPSGSKLIYNPSSIAPGFIIKNIICLPGIPSIIKSMIDNLKNYLKSGSKTYSLTINMITVESKIAKELSVIQKKYKKFVDIGSYPFFRLEKIGVSVVSRSTSKMKLESVNRDLIKLVRLKKIEILKI